VILLNDFFIIQELSQTTDSAKAMIAIDPAHAIFTGHFPGQPVVPGVCMMQIVKEIIEAVTGKRINMGTVQEMKFLALIDPLKNNLIEVELKFTTDNTASIQVSSTMTGGGVLHFKFKGRLDVL
jgi:3-hydroxyacyl-[acyl-carrier-protein] dehydratase